MVKYKMSLIFLIALIMLITVAGCGGNGEQADETDSTLVVAVPVDIVGFDPVRIVCVPSFQVIKNINEYLVSIDTDGSYLPMLAESWDISDDLMTFTFYLREEINFTDGTPFNAEVVKFNYARLLDEDISVNIGNYSNIDSVEVVDEYTVQFNLKSPQASFIDTHIADHAAVMCSPAAIEQYGDDYMENPVGTGPFMLSEYERGVRVVMEANPNYWNGEIKLDRLVFRTITDTETALLELETGGVHLVTTLTPEHYDRLLEHPDISVDADPNHTMRGIYYDLSTPLMQDVRMRKAIHHAINVDEIVEYLCGEVVVRAAGPTPIISWAHKADYQEPEFDPARAEQLLEEMGWVEGSDGVRVKDGQRLTLRFLGPNGRYIKDKEIVDAVVSDLSAVGIEAVPEVVEGSQVWPKIEEQAGYELTFTGIGPRPTGDPSDQPLYITHLSTSPLNFFGSEYPELDELMRQGNLTVDQEERTQIYYQVQELFEDEVMGVWMYSDKALAAVSTKVKGYQHSGVKMVWLYNDVYVEE